MTLIVKMDGIEKTLRPAFSSNNFAPACRYRHWNVIESGAPVSDISLPTPLKAGMKFRTSGHDFEIIKLPSRPYSHHPAITYRG